MFFDSSARPGFNWPGEWHREVPCVLRIQIPLACQVRCARILVVVRDFPCLHFTVYLVNGKFVPIHSTKAYRATGGIAPLIIDLNLIQESYFSDLPINWCLSKHLSLRPQKPWNSIRHVRCADSILREGVTKNQPSARTLLNYSNFSFPATCFGS